MTGFSCSCRKDIVPLDHSSYLPIERSDWNVSDPEEQDLNPDLVLEIYREASQINHLYSLLIIKNNHLVGERYFGNKDVNGDFPIASVTKCFTSTLTGIALSEGYLSSLTQKMVEFFPEVDWEKEDPRKSEITIEQILKMRSGYPWEEFSEYEDLLWSSFGDWIPLLTEFQLESEPGTQYGYSNLMSHMLGIIISRATDSPLRDFAQTYLFDPLGLEVETWWIDHQGYNFGHGDLHLTPRGLARFGQVYIDQGIHEGIQIIPSEWITQSLKPYSFNIYGREILSDILHLNLGYMNWFSGTSGVHEFRFGWGHGGQLVFLLQDLQMVIVTTADYLPGQFGEEAWAKEKSVLEMVGRFIARLPES